MTKLPVYFDARFRTLLAGLTFLAEVQCDDTAALRERCLQNEVSGADIELTAAEICFDLTRADGKGCRIFDDESVGLLSGILKSLKVGAQHFYNESLGSYNPFTRRVEPVDFGIVFPDGTARIVWDSEEAATNFDETLEVLAGAVSMLLELQDIPYGQATEAELDEGNYEPCIARRTEVLFEAGLWPDTQDGFEPLAELEQAAVLDKYRAMPAYAEA